MEVSQQQYQSKVTDKNSLSGISNLNVTKTKYVKLEIRFTSATRFTTQCQFFDFFCPNLEVQLKSIYQIQTTKCFLVKPYISCKKIKSQHQPAFWPKQPCLFTTGKKRKMWLLEIMWLCPFDRIDFYSQQNTLMNNYTSKMFLGPVD